MSIDDQIWYAINQTRILAEPKKVLETFGVTNVKYYIISESMDAINQVTVREGSVVSEKPAIITPAHFARQILSGFGSEANEYADWLTKHGEMIQILQYGLQLRKEEIKEESVQANLSDVKANILNKVSQGNEFAVVIEGSDEYWEISLMKFMQDFVQRSAPKNFQDIREQEDYLRKEEEYLVRSKIEDEFYEARGNKTKLTDLGKKLQDMGRFSHYEDRFFALLKECS